MSHTTGDTDSGGGPQSRTFTGLTKEWAVAVAHELRRLARSSGSAPLVEEIWLTSDLALNVRYRVGAETLAARFGRLDVDPTSLGVPHDSARLASDLLHNLHGAPDRRSWTDELGHEWWGDAPAQGWEAAAGGDRVLTLT